jgi:hypothetical protein
MNKKYFNTQKASTIVLFKKWVIEPISKIRISLMTALSQFIRWYIFSRDYRFFSPNTIVLLIIWYILILMQHFHRSIL